VRVAVKAGWSTGRDLNPRIQVLQTCALAASPPVPEKDIGVEERDDADPSYTKFYPELAEPMTQLDYFIVDVFTESPLQGNPLAVVMNTCGLNTAQMQAIAREFNLSETTFVERRNADVERTQGVRVRIFTTREELNFAGHPTLGTATVLKLHAPETVNDEVVTLALNVGAIPVRFAAHGLFGEMTQRDPEFGDELDPGTVSRIAGLTVEDLHPSLPPQVVSTGTAFAILVLRSMEPLSRIQVDHHEAAARLAANGAELLYVLAPAGPPADGFISQWRARMQFYGGEDPATGSAAGCAISYLVKRGAVPGGCRIHLRQGIEISRPSDLFLTANLAGARVTNVRVAGSTVSVATGQLFLP
jgi:trans-2,3-dihydro-3-hydroxyanthranilate isomerase